MKKKKEQRNVNGSFCAGDKFAHKEGTGYIKVMAIADGYVMGRNKGCIPFCENIDEFIVRLEKNCRLSDVSSSLPCHHNYIQKDTYWKSCTHCGMIAPLGQ